MTGVGKFFEVIVGVAFKKLEKQLPAPIFISAKYKKNTNAKMHNEIKYRNKINSKANLIAYVIANMIDHALG